MHTDNANTAWPRIAAMVLGGWLFVSAFFWLHSPAQYWNALVCGVLAVVFAAVAALRMPRARYLNTGLGVWLFLSAWTVERYTLATAWNVGIVGTLLAAVSLIPGGQAPRRALAH